MYFVQGMYLEVVQYIQYKKYRTNVQSTECKGHFISPSITHHIRSHQRRGQKTDGSADGVQLEREPSEARARVGEFDSEPVPLAVLLRLVCERVARGGRVRVRVARRERRVQCGRRRGHQLRRVRRVAEAEAERQLLERRHASASRVERHRRAAERVKEEVVRAFTRMNDGQMTTDAQYVTKKCGSTRLVSSRTSDKWNTIESGTDRRDVL